ncbi:lipid-A-disaccharide kinase [Marinobacter daqiaonensis]|uniref:Tetraacyldisaccharide 4'-kinase n=1 Tax=Marinobacter daqiaonensis TaxID=650891 RepID=A0A1I6H1R4_9GAMM|nr:tetraacyldisaccharide 4'-kinase [Marinobacter daqiaonensis]SFR48379.1 lipid-A-disaccharide kinase [Marinobacter daqiaonensis]
MADRIETLWYRKGRPLWPLLPLAWLYQAVSRYRRRRLQAEAEPLPLPVIVVGNITAGGTGKSPLTAWVAGQLKAEGWRPVILSRGYGAKRPSDRPLVVTPASDPAEVGDEPVMLASQTACPVVVHPRRLQSAEYAMALELGNIFLCDDGLQHYHLARDLELVVFDGSRGIGNGESIPVGPLREMPSRVAEADFVVVNGEPGPGVPEHPQRFTMHLEPVAVRNLVTGESHSPDWLEGRHCHAIAGIGNPGRFFAELRARGADVKPRSFPDHHHYSPADIESGDRPLLMTAKDAVKIRSFAHGNCWVLDVEARLPETFRPALRHALARKMRARGLTPDIQ